MTTLKTIKLLALSILFIGLYSCNSDDDETPLETTLTTKRIENLHAPGDIRSQTTGEIIQEGVFHYFSFSTETEVLVTDNWDIAFKGSVIIVNSGVNGDTQAAATIITSTFDEITTAPDDADFSIDTAIANAIPTGSGNGWYTFNMTTHLYTPIAGKIIVVRTHDGKYAKIEMLSYYRDQTTTPTPQDGGYITFDFVYQPNGTKNF